MLQNQLQNGSPIGRGRTPPSPLHVEAEIVVSAFEEEHPDLPLPPTLGVEMGRQVVGGVNPQLESIDFECFDLSQQRLWISRPRKCSADRTFCQSLANDRWPASPDALMDEVSSPESRLGFPAGPPAVASFAVQTNRRR